MARRVGVTVVTLAVLAGGVLGVATTQASATGSPPPSTLRPSGALDPVPAPVPIPEMVPREPGPIAMPLVEPHGRPVPMPLVDQDRSAGLLVPHELRRGR